MATGATSGAGATAGAQETIDVAAWDASKDDLMRAILIKFANDNDHIKRILNDNDLSTLVDDTMPDHYWPAKMPIMWREVKAKLM